MTSLEKKIKYVYGVTVFSFILSMQILSRTMKCTIPGANMKVLARAVQALARIGDELYVEPDVNCMSFRSVNSSRSAYASVTFNKPFFAFYKHEQSQSLTQEDSSKCKISMKSCLPVFRSPVMLDKKVENCIMRLEDDGSKVIFEMRFRHGISKTHFLPVIECETLQVVYTKDDASNCLLAQVQLFSDAVHNFHSTQEEVTLFATSQKTSIRSYVDGAINPSKMKSTEILLDPAEFDKYTVNSETSITFCLKEFRALLSFAEATGQCIEACFDTGGKPVLFCVKYENTYEANFVLSTLSPEIDSQTPTPQRIRANNTNHTPTVISEAPSKEPFAPARTKQTSPKPPEATRTPVNDDPLVDKLPSCTPIQERISVQRGESPSLLSAVRSRNASTASQHVQARVDKSNQLLKKATENVRRSSQDELVNNASNGSQQNRLNSSHVCNSRISSIPNVISQDRSKDSSSIHDFNTPPMMMSETSSISLQLRESDADDDDTVASSPQPPKKRPRLFDIFDSTFNPSVIPGHNVIIAEDSGDEQV